MAPTPEISSQRTGIPSQRSADPQRPGPINKTVRLTTNDAAGQHLIRLSGRVKAKAKEEGLPQKEGIFNKQNGKNN